MNRTSCFLISSIIALISCGPKKSGGETEITRWPDAKPAAVSITLDDASINQFRKALPIMDSLGLKATFFIITNQVDTSKIQPEFQGRPIPAIIRESVQPTTSDNFFERASALRFTDLEDAIERHNKAGELYENGKTDEAYKVVDDAFAKIREEHPSKKKNSAREHDRITWTELRKFAANGHEFGSHTLSHPRLAVLDEANMLYELGKSKEEIGNQLGAENTFSAECPFGTENERVMGYALPMYPALRNRMPEKFLAELNRASKKTPGEFQNEYIQWQRGPLQKTTPEQMNAWIDTLLVHDNVWLVLTFHGVDGIGWEAKPHEELAEYFGYMKSKEDRLWIATFRDVTKYMRERMNSSIKVDQNASRIRINLKHSLDPAVYRLPLTLQTYIDPAWTDVAVVQGSQTVPAVRDKDDKGQFVRYKAIPNGPPIEISVRR